MELTDWLWFTGGHYVALMWWAHGCCIKYSLLLPLLLKAKTLFFSSCFWNMLTSEFCCVYLVDPESTWRLCEHRWSCCESTPTWCFATLDTWLKAWGNYKTRVSSGSFRGGAQDLVAESDNPCCCSGMFASFIAGWYVSWRTIASWLHHYTIRRQWLDK